MLEWLGEEKRRRNNCEWIIFQRVSMIRRTIRRCWIHRSLSQHPCYITSKFPNFYRTVLFSYLDCFPALYDSYSFIIHPCVELSLLHSLMYFHSFFAVFAFSNGCMFLTWSMFTYLIELHLLPKMLSSQNTNADQKAANS